MTDRRNGAASAARWVVPSVVVSVAAVAVLQMTADRWPDLRTVYRFLPPVVALALLGLLYGNWIRRDRLAFLSVAIPAVALMAGSALVRWPWSGVLLWIAVGIIVGVAWWTPMRSWWTVHVLRRPPLTPRRLFRGGLRSDIFQWSSALRGDGRLTPRQRGRAEAAIVSMRRREAPDDQLGTIRDDLVDVATRWTATPRDEEHAQDYVDLRDELTRVQARLWATVDDD